MMDEPFRAKVEGRRAGYRNGEYRGPAVLGFIDLLGFTSKIAETWGDEEGALESLLAIKRDFESRKPIGIVLEGSGKRIDQGDKTHFPLAITVSDSFVIYEGCRRDGEDVVGAFFGACIAISQMQEIALRYGFAVRGAVELGEIYVGDRETIGPAFNMAYGLESKLAQVSRILIGPALLHNLSGILPKNMGYPYMLGEMIYIGKDGLAAVRPTIQVADAMRKLKETVQDPYVAEKYDECIGNAATPEVRDVIWRADIIDALSELKARMGSVRLPWPKSIAEDVIPTPPRYLDRGRDARGRLIAPAKPKRKRPPHGGRRGKGRR